MRWNRTTRLSRGRSIERIVTTPTQSLARPLGLPLIEVEARMTRKLEEAGHDVSEILEDLKIAQAETLANIMWHRDEARREDLRVYQEANVSKKVRDTSTGEHPGERGVGSKTHI